MLAYNLASKSTFKIIIADYIARLVCRYQLSLDVELMVFTHFWQMSNHIIVQFVNVSLHQYIQINIRIFIFLQ